MKIGIYNPYFSSLSGGERYVLELASHWSHTHHVDIFWDDKDLRHTAQKRLNIDLSNVSVAVNFFSGKNILKKLLMSRRYDLIFFLTDGSIPTTLAKCNILHFQVPFEHLAAPQWKLNGFDAVVCNSLFTKTHLDKRLGSRGIVIYPPVNTKAYKTKGKEEIILSVGRFSKSKKQEILIEVFAHLSTKKILHGWKLVLAGGLLKSDEDYFHNLRQLSLHSPIELLPNVSYDTLTSLYERASIYWHGAGFEEVDPMRMEHFGISTVEAMSAGCIPVVVNLGGLPEIVEHGVSGFLWNTKEELENYSYSLMQKNNTQEGLRKAIEKRASIFDRENFYRAYDTLLAKITR